MRDVQSSGKTAYYVATEAMTIWIEQSCFKWENGSTVGIFYPMEIKPVRLALTPAFEIFSIMRGVGKSRSHRDPSDHWTKARARLHGIAVNLRVSVHLDADGDATSRLLPFICAVTSGLLVRDNSIKDDQLQASRDGLITHLTNDHAQQLIRMASIIKTAQSEYRALVAPSVSCA